MEKQIEVSTEPVIADVIALVKPAPIIAKKNQDIFLKPIRRFFTVFLLGFVGSSLLMIYLLKTGVAIPDIFHIRVSMLDQILADTPLGRQSLICSLNVPPVPIFASLPFLPFMQFFGVMSTAGAYILGLAACVGLLAATLGQGLRSSLEPLGGMISLLLSGLLTYYLFGCQPDLLAVIAFLLVGIGLDRNEQPIVRACSGIAYTLCAMSHPWGWAVLLIRLIVLLVSRLLAFSAPSKQAIIWVQTFGLLYGLVMYLFLNGILMRDAFYPLNIHFSPFSAQIPRYYWPAFSTGN